MHRYRYAKYSTVYVENTRRPIPVTAVIMLYQWSNYQNVFRGALWRARSASL